MPKRGYWVHIADEDTGLVVIGPSAKYAKRHAFICELDAHAEWIEIRVKWCKDVDVSDLPMGLLEDEILGLRRGLYAWLEDATCDICGDYTTVEHIGLTFQRDGVIACSDCIDMERSDYHIQVLEMEVNNALN